MVHVRRASGHDALVELRSDAGDGTAYELPGHAVTRLRPDHPQEAQRHYYIQIPGALWTQGWMSILTGPAVAMLMVLLNEQQLSRGRPLTMWLSPAMAENRYGISKDTRSKGLLQLEQADLVTVQRKPVSPDSFDYQRVRNLLTYHPEVLTDRLAAVRSKATRADIRRRDDRAGGTATTPSPTSSTDPWAG